MALPLVAIVGRPNVGKSALFNRLLGERRAIVDPMAGLTRDRLYAEVEWRGRRFVIVDTAGLVLGKDRDEVPEHRELRRRMEQQSRLAIEEADLVLFVVDLREGVTAVDRDIAELLRKSRTPVMLVTNKADGRGREALAGEFYELGIGDPWVISALHGTGSGDLLDGVVERLPPPKPELVDEQLAARIAILGRPNVGKSSLVNALTGDERSLVTTVPGTTRDPVDTTITFEGKRVLLVDTAGIRRPGLTRGVEQYSLLRGLRAMERADIGIVVIDAREGITAQDVHIAGYVVEAGRGLVLALNKWDLLTAEEKEEKEWRRRIREQLRFAPWAPVSYISAKTGQRVSQPLEVALKVVEERRRRVATPELNRWLRTILAERDAPTRKGKRLRIMYATQAEATTPTFVFFVNDPELVHFSYQRFLETQLRKAFGFAGTPIRLVFRKRG
ncbi:MAG TPA: ribosome biogenesis GTPase Der, partial [Candidatus Dormibacteraeota bacterium]|nr:ribosome biogenesis GTPase Der [Candidatus Dormibacteraeota bacterium]